MSFLIDGNNLSFALLDDEGNPLSRSGLCDRLASALPADERVCVVFDGPPPDSARAAQIAGGVHVEYAAPLSADQVIMRLIQDDTAPRRLTVVSTDREIRRAARRRRCRSVTSEQFASFVERRRHPGRPTKAVEPQEKTRGLSPQQLDAWLEVFEGDRPDDDNIEL